MSNRATSSSTTAGSKQHGQTAQGAQHAQTGQTGMQTGMQQKQTTQHQASGTNTLHDKIAMRAYEKWCKRGCPHGTDKQDWYDAETEVRMEQARQGGATTTRR